MVNLFRPKTMRRMAVFMALVAPIVYLFGSYFTYLAGAHGSVDASYQLQSEYTAKVIQEYDVVNYQDVHFQDTITGGVASWSPAEHPYLADRSHYYYYSFEITVSSDAYRFRPRYPFLYTNGIYPTDGVVSFSGYSYWSSETNFGDYLWFQVLGNSGTVIDLNFSFTRLQVIDLNVGFPDLTSTSDLQNAYESYLSGREYVKGVTYQDYLVSYTGDAFDYLSHGFFANDNLLVQMGRDALSPDPHGFAPFGYFWRYLDTNILHLSSEQVGLMAYGYMYYAAHVLLFDVGFMLVTFFLSFIQKVGDKMGGEER